MELEKREECYKKFVKVFGEEAQIMLAIEEMSELTKELCKYFRAKGDSVKLEKVKENIIEETADVLTIAETLRLMFGEEQVDEMMERKILRGQERCEEKLNKNNLS